MVPSNGGKEGRKTEKEGGREKEENKLTCVIHLL